MYQIVRIEDMVRVPAEHFNEELEVTLKNILAEQYEGKLDREVGSLISVLDVKSDGIGRVIPGDGAAYYNASFRALTYKPELQEIVEGDVIEIVEFGAFIRLGPLDGLVHVSQITDDYLNYDEKGQKFVGKESKKTLAQGDKVRARIVTISLKKAKENKIGLTMRQPGLGKLEWINEKEPVPTEKKALKKKEGRK
ncbi:TPA: DNA-directed RNA polymerase [archaeon]|jgi:DNA-directed RNA polymerase subunit E'|uniref:DNA-directed RNA polymerase subunit Rpo7 n=1 Tax=Candidatus Undinarchaeum marinum TaxID=2756141 RepID=A0A832XIW9_9ARCH|nr:DNA-directed RNA polymerase [Candidatus Undinarchaeum marinum]